MYNDSREILRTLCDLVICTSQSGHNKGGCIKNFMVTIC